MLRNAFLVAFALAPSCAALASDNVVAERAQLFECHDGYKLAWNQQADGSVIATVNECGVTGKVAVSLQSPACPRDSQATALNASMAKKWAMDVLAVARAAVHSGPFDGELPKQRPDYVSCHPDATS